jgi:ribosomal-protein-alanine N-acetyltransferase
MNAAALQPGLPWHRPMTVQDLDEVLAIEAASYSFPWSRGNFIDSLAAGYLAELWFDAQQQCLGYLVAMPGVEEMHLLNITVTPRHQRLGHGRAMLLYLAEHGRERGDHKLWLEVRDSNTGARRLYEQLGYVAVGRRRHYYPAAGGRREDAVVMSLALHPGGSHALD